MPTYEYACTACKERLEIVQRFTDTSLTECPACGGLLRKIFSPVGVVFKGSGFYKTDSRGSSKNGSSASSDGKKDAAAKSDSGGSSAPPDSGGSSSSSSTAPSGGTSSASTSAAAASSPVKPARAAS